jgi:hypothetical protein
MKSWHLQPLRASGGYSKGVTLYQMLTGEVPRGL